MIIGCDTNEPSSYKTVIKSTNSKTNYSAVIENYGYYYWVSIHHGESSSALFSCFLWSNKSPIPKSEIPASFNGNPPISEEYASDRAIISGFSTSSLKIIWSDNGKTAAILMDQEPVCVCDVPNKKGYSISIKKSGPYGLPWDENIYNEKFKIQ